MKIGSAPSTISSTAPMRGVPMARIRFPSALISCAIRTVVIVRKDAFPWLAAKHVSRNSAKVTLEVVPSATGGIANVAIHLRHCLTVVSPSATTSTVPITSTAAARRTALFLPEGFAETIPILVMAVYRTPKPIALDTPGSVASVKSTIALCIPTASARSASKSTVSLNRRSTGALEARASNLRPASLVCIPTHT